LPVSSFEIPFPVSVTETQAIPVFDCFTLEKTAHKWRCIGERLPVTWDDSIQIDQVRDATRDTISDPSDYHSGIAVANEDHLLQIFRLNETDHILNMSIESNLRGTECCFFS
jgi:hypothetical protein